MSKKEWLTIAGSAGAGLFVLVILTLAAPMLKHSPQETRKDWNRDGIRAAYVATQLRELDKTHSSLILSYDLSNLTETDYRLAEGSDSFLLTEASV